MKARIAQNYRVGAGDRVFWCYREGQECSGVIESVESWPGHMILKIKDVTPLDHNFGRSTNTIPADMAYKISQGGRITDPGYKTMVIPRVTLPDDPSIEGVPLSWVPSQGVLFDFED